MCNILRYMGVRKKSYSETTSIFYSAAILSLDLNVFNCRLCPFCELLNHLGSIHIAARTAIDDYYLFHYCQVVIFRCYLPVFHSSV